MGRPIKNTADWFPHEKGLRNSPKMKALRHHHGIAGVAIYLFIWEYLLDCEHQRVQYTNETLDVWSIDFEYEIECIRKVVECCLKYKLLQIDSSNNIYSEDLDDKLSPLFLKRTNDRKRLEGSRSDNSSSRSDNGSSRGDNSSSHSDNSSSRSDNGSSRGDNSSSRSDNGSSRSDNGSSRSDNGSSRSDNGSSRSDLKIQYILHNSTKHSPSADIRARGDDAGALVDEEQQEMGNEAAAEVADEDDTKYTAMLVAEVDAEINALLTDAEWKKQVFERFKFLNYDEKTLQDFLLRWAGEVKMRNRGHTDLTDAKEHLKNWLIIQEGKLNQNSISYGTDNNNGYRSSEDIYEGAASIIRKLRTEGTAKYTTPLPEV